jgi:hypothetical protein
MAIESSGKASSASLRRASSGAISSDVLRLIRIAAQRLRELLQIERLERRPFRVGLRV